MLISATSRRFFKATTNTFPNIERHTQHGVSVGTKRENTKLCNYIVVFVSQLCNYKQSHPVAVVTMSFKMPYIDLSASARQLGSRAVVSEYQSIKPRTPHSHTLAHRHNAHRCHAHRHLTCLTFSHYKSALHSEHACTEGTRSTFVVTITRVDRQ